MSSLAAPPPLLALLLLAAALGLVSEADSSSSVVFCQLPGLGWLHGRSLRSARNTSFAAFEGVPYAKPPVGGLRFQPPQPVEHFGFLEARSQRSPCPYLNDKGVLIGGEDCLYLSVYTPQVDAALGLPVVVVLAGEDWARGYAGRWKPHRLVDREVVVVTVQSRLGALGFLATGDAAAPGNLGLRDERMALAWVRQYIGAFGGDPDKVTLAGVGAGAAATTLHVLAGQSAPGLFQRAIAVSGSALSPWTLTEAGQDADDDQQGPAHRLAEAVGCDCRAVTAASANATATANTTAASARPANVTEVLECLRSRPVADIVHGAARLQGWAGLPPSPFSAVVERPGNGSFLSDAPRRLWTLGAAPRVPLLVGLARSEGLQALAPWPTGGLLNNSALLGQLDADWARLAPQLLAFNATPEAGRRAAADQLRRRYLGAAALADAKDGLLWLFGDRHVVVPALRAAVLHAAKHPVFVYRFAWNAALGASALAGPAGGSDAALLLMEPLASEARSLPAQRAMAEDILDVWTSFIKDGTPSVGNTTFQSLSGSSSSSSSSSATSSLEVPFVELVRPGVQRPGNWSVGELLDFWDALPLRENQRPASGSAAGKGSAGTGQSDPRRSDRSPSSSPWSHAWLPLLAAMPFLCANLS